MKYRESPVYQGFVERFGQANADAVVAAAESHAGELVTVDRGDDEFKWALIVCIGRECVTRFTEDHGITADPDEIKEWVYLVGDLGTYVGPVPDMLAVLIGQYQGWVNHDAARWSPALESSDD